MPTCPEDFVPQPKEGNKGWEAFHRAPKKAVALFDGDGTMWPIVKYPDLPSNDRRYLPRYPRLFRRLIGQIAVAGMLTGRSVMQVRDFGLLVPGIHVIGQFGAEHYHGGAGERQPEHTVWVKRPALKEVDRRLRQLLNDPRMAGASLEDVKSHFRAVHYQDDIGEWLLGQLAELADATGLAVLPGSGVVELGPPEVNKEVSLRRFVSELPLEPSVVLYAGDSKPDLGAFKVLDGLRNRGVPTVKVCASDDADVVEHADLLVRGPERTLAMMERLCEITAR